jgi:hypothetical protein
VFVHEHASRWDLVCACFLGEVEGVELAIDRLFTFLFVRRYRAYSAARFIAPPPETAVSGRAD